MPCARLATRATTPQCRRAAHYPAPGRSLRCRSSSSGSPTARSRSTAPTTISPWSPSSSTLRSSPTSTRPATSRLAPSLVVLLHLLQPLLVGVALRAAQEHDREHGSHDDWHEDRAGDDDLRPRRAA